jgi:UDP-N-acetylglucosamine 2-epimerase
MIYIVIGTKAQFIKMAPVIKRLDAENLRYTLIDLGQHSEISFRLRNEFEIRTPDIILGLRNINRIAQGLKWMGELFLKGINKRWLRENVFKSGRGVCLIHGDTASTLLALYLANRAGLKVAHIEAGLRSWHLWEPFPEEMIRVVSMYFSDILFAPSRWAYGNLIKMKLDKKAILLSANTSLESTLWSLNKRVELKDIPERFALITAHRMENIFNKSRLKFIVNVIKKAADILAVVFIYHHPTLSQLRRYGFMSELEKILNLYIRGITSHAQFIHLINKSEFVITDGGSVQEECYYLNKPCLLLRNYTERMEGVGENIIVSKFSSQVCEKFIKNYNSYRRKTELPQCSPSAEIIEYLKDYVR